MKIISKCVHLCLVVVIMVVLSACAPEIGSEKWCTDMKEKPKADWSANEATDFAKHCILK